MATRDAVIISTARTPIGRAYKGAFNATPGASLGARCFPRPSMPSRTRPTMEATTTKITIMATTMEVTDAPFRQSMSSGTGKELSYRSYSHSCDACGAGGTALGP